ncbi:Quinate/shikimate dehydrogenase [Pannonibacter phragmitetus]|uniref:shikimate dehydrogenase (NADP(+)) n=1 Tax=Pannonibacter phragmitetus TaxID=121719 RepID=A0A378ZSJ9_9HYPH|nr:shikimate dehydrogenase [Pannonibacter phragmitetus]SUB00117.1 Quinate/shikimate dehydrogenase [Pannonibacter phragmitetus]
MSASSPAAVPQTGTIRLGLIGDNIAASSSPRLHVLAGLQNGRTVTYDRLVPREMGMEFDPLFAHVAADGYRGVNVTYPYKERAAAKVQVDDPLVRAIGAVNTVIFEDGKARGFNTDYSGFIAAYRALRGDAAPGPVLMIGAGGVGKAVAFGLIALGLSEIRIADRDVAKADALAEALKAVRPDLVTRTGPEAAELAAGASGLINCTPVGMVGYGGTPLERAFMTGAAWVFDAVYTPVDTPFLKDAEAEGLTIISGYELFFGQGVDAWAIFTGLPLDHGRLRQDLLKPE